MAENSCVPRHQLWKLMQQACKIPLSCQPDQGISKLIHLHFLKKQELIHQLICEFELADHHTWRYIYLSLASHMKKRYSSSFPNKSQYPIKSLIVLRVYKRKLGNNNGENQNSNVKNQNSNAENQNSNVENQNLITDLVGEAHD